MKLKPRPVHGQTRTRTRFAFLPTDLSPTERIWLERYVQIDRYVVISGNPADPIPLRYWRTTDRYTIAQYKVR